MEEYLQRTDNQEHRARMREILEWVSKTFPSLQYTTKWSQPMFLDHGTYIIGFSTAKNHFSVAPEMKAMEHFSREIGEDGYSQTPNLFRIGWEDPVDYALLERIIAYNITDKAQCATFWRK